MKRATLEDISGGDAAENAAIVREVLSGKEISAARCGLVELRGRAGGGGTGGSFGEWNSSWRRKRSIPARPRGSWRRWQGLLLNNSAS